MTEDLLGASVDTHTLNPSAARLAANENEFIGNIHNNDDHLKQDELSEWIGEILGKDMKPSTLFDDLSSGVSLLYLAKSIQLIKCHHQKDSEYEKAVKNLQPDNYRVTDHGPPKVASDIAKQRSNIAKFLEWCANIGVPQITLFETEDLIVQKNLRQVTTCLFYVSRIASKFGIEPPSSVKEQLKIEEGKSLHQSSEDSSSPIVRPQTKDEKPLIIDKMMERYHTQTSSLESKSNDQSTVIGTLNQFSTIPLYDDDAADEPVHILTPLELTFEESYQEAVVVKALQENFGSQDSRPSQNARVTEDQNLTATESYLFRPLDMPVEYGTTAVNDTTEVPVPRAVLSMRELNDNAEERSRPSSSSSENEDYRKAVAEYDNDFMYYTSFVDDEIDDVYLGRNPAISETYQRSERPQDICSPITSSFEEIAQMKSASPNAPFALFCVPTGIAIETRDDSETSSDDSAAEIESFSFDDCKNEKTFADVAVGTEDLEEKYFVEKKKEEEIMIDFPPYFELSSWVKEYPILPPPHEYIVAPARNDAIYAAPMKSRARQREAQPTSSYSDPERSPVGYRRTDTERAQPESRTSSSNAPIPVPIVRHKREDFHKETGTQTHVTFTEDMLHILTERDSHPRNRTTSSSLSSGSVARQSSGNTTIIRTQYQRTLPTSDKDVSITQVSDLDSVRPARWGSVNSSTRHHRIEEPEIELARPTVRRQARRSIVRRTSSMLSERFVKAVAIAKKYQKQIIIIGVLLLLTIGALTAMLVVFPST